MVINSLSFIAFLLAALGVFHLAPRGWRAQAVFPLTSLGFMALSMPSWQAFGAVLGFVLLIWLAVQIIARRPTQGMLMALLGFVLLIFGWLKAYTFLSFLPFTELVPATLGLSYMLIRGLQLLMDAREDASLRPAALTVFSFLTSWPCLVSGPVQRYQEFEAQLRGMATFQLTDAVWLESLRRILKGWFWVLVLGDISKHLWLGLKVLALQEAYPLAFGGSQLAFLVHLFFDFAGYTEIVIGVGGLFGLKLPENFASPFAARSFLDFWSRWHLTMSNWFKVYVFNPLLMMLTARWPSQRASKFAATAAFFVTFFLVGLWHGTTTEFVICGLALGFGASGNQWFRTLLRAGLGKKRFDALSAQWTYGMVAKGLTFAYLCMSLMPLWLKTSEMQQLLSRYGFSGLLISQLFVFLVMAVTAPLRMPSIPQPRAVAWQCFKIGLQCALIEMYLLLFPSFGGAFFYQQF